MTQKIKTESKTKSGASLAPSSGYAPPSAADKDALNRLPSHDWFDLRSVPWIVRNPRWRCDRLTKLGALESKIDGEWPDIKTMWRKTHNDPDQRPGRQPKA